MREGVRNLSYTCTLDNLKDFACVNAKSLQHVQLVTPWIVAHQAPLSMGVSRQEYWRGLLCPSPGDLPHPGIKPIRLTSPKMAGEFFTTSFAWEALKGVYSIINVQLKALGQ